MDQAVLVAGRVVVPAEQRDGGAVLIARLRANGIDLRGAVWAAIYDDDRPYLYLISQDVEDHDSRPIYQKVAAARLALAGEGLPLERRIGREVVKLIPPSSPLAQSILSIYRRYPDDQSTVHHESGLGSGTIDGAYIYPASLFKAQPAPEPAAAAPPAGV